MTESNARDFIFRWRDSVWNCDQISPSIKLTLLALSDWADVDGTQCFPSIESIAARTGQHRRTVRRCLIEGSDWFERVANQGVGQAWANYWYTLVIPEFGDTRTARQCSKGRGAAPSRSRQRGGQSVQKVGASCPKREGVRPYEVITEITSHIHKGSDTMKADVELNNRDKTHAESKKPIKGHWAGRDDLANFFLEGSHE